jgi:hypothetical protein
MRNSNGRHIDVINGVELNCMKAGHNTLSCTQISRFFCGEFAAFVIF